MKKFLQKNREIIAYLFFGVVTTIASKGVYFLVLAIAEHAFGMSPSEVSFDIVRSGAKLLDWIVGVGVAFITNKNWVFMSTKTSTSQTLSELGKFAVSRVGTGALDLVLSIAVVRILYATSYQSFTFVLEFTPDLWSQIISSIVVIISNYVISKFIVFKKRKSEG